MRGARPPGFPEEHPLRRSRFRRSLGSPTSVRAVGGDAIRIEASGLRLALATGLTSRLRFTRPAAVRHSKPGVTKPPRRNSAPDGDLELFYQPLFPSANRKLRTAPP